MTYKLGGVPTQRALYIERHADSANYTPLSTGIANLSPQPDEAFSVFFWGLGTTTNATGLMASQRNISSPYDGWDIGVEGSSAFLQASVHSDSGIGAYPSRLRSLQAITAGGYGPALNRNGWYHFGFTYDGTGNTSGIALYLNGQAQTTTNTLSSGTAGEFTAGSIAIKPFSAGFIESSWVIGNSFTMCQYAAFSGALSATQVQDIYSGNGDRPGPCDLRNKLGGAAGITLRGYWLYGNDADTVTTLQDGTANNFDLTGVSLTAGQLLGVNI